MIDVQTVDAASTITLLEAIEALYPLMMLIQVFLDNARYHHAKLVQQWLARPGCRIKLHFISSYCPHLNPIRLWALMNRNVTHTKSYATCAQFADATLGGQTSSSLLGALLRFSHRQLPRHLAQKFSGHDVNGYSYHGLTKLRLFCHND
jgi:transposase